LNDKDHSNNNNINESDLLDEFLPVTYKLKKALLGYYRYDNHGRTKKFMAMPANLQSEDNMQGLWTMPGRR
jgi:hypothetical protein